MSKAILLVLSILIGQLTVFAETYPIVVQLGPTGRLPQVAAALRGNVVAQIPGTSTYLLNVPALPMLTRNPVLGIESIEVNGMVSLRRPSPMGILATPASADWYGGQPALNLVGMPGAHAVTKGRGVVVADLNSRIDYGHPALVGHLTGGYDFVATSTSNSAVLNQSMASFLDQSSANFLDQSSASFMDQSSASFMDQSTASFLDQSTASFLDQSTASFLDQSMASFLDTTNPAHGHGTMVAGLIAVVAPESMIMPLRVFDDSGAADTFSIIRAIRYAVANGAHVINLSFGMTSESPAVRSAITYAISNGVTVVASGGNNNSAEPQYPAAFSGVLGVAGTDLLDRKASFSNYGSAISVAAPGMNIISAYPGGYYAMASGTSFSAPIVAGEAALVRSMQWTGVASAVTGGTVNIDAMNPDYAGKLGSGRINMMKAVVR